MSGVALRYDLSANERLQRHIDRIAGLDRRELLGLIGETVASQVNLRFVDGEDPDGKKWETSQRVKLQGGQTLINDGILRGSISSYIYLDGSAVEVGSNLVYAATHQFGDDSRNIPARPFLGLSADNEAELVDVVEAWLAEVLQ